MTQFQLPQPAAKLCSLTAQACFVVIVLTIIVAGALTPGYNHVSQFISELGARGATLEWGVRVAGFLPAGILLLAFCWFAYVALPRSVGTTLGLIGLALYAAGYLVATAFPCDLGCRPAVPSTSQIIHNAGGMIGYLLAPAFLLALALATRAWPGARVLTVTGYVASALALVGLLTLSPASPFVGLSQRLLEFSVLGWVAYCGRYLAKQGARSR